MRHVNHGDTVGPYRLVRELGGGGMGTVFHATSSQGDVALKVLAPSSGNATAAHDLLRRELIASRAVESARIARPLDWNLDDDPPWIAYTLIAGTSLADVLREQTGRSLRLSRLLPIFVDVVKALVAIHGQGIIHRDVKPANIQVTPKGEAVLLDLGVAVIGESSEYTRDAWGTDGYRAPEQQWGRSSDPRSDVWSWAVCLAEAAAGRKPFGSPYAEDYYRRLRGVPQMVGWPAPLIGLLNTSLRDEPANRPTATEVLTLLQDDIVPNWSRAVRIKLEVYGHSRRPTSEDDFAGDIVTRTLDEPLDVSVTASGIIHCFVHLGPTPIPGFDGVVERVGYTFEPEVPLAGDFALLDTADGARLGAALTEYRDGSEKAITPPRSCPACSAGLEWLDIRRRPVVRGRAFLWCSAGEDCCGVAAWRLFNFASSLLPRRGSCPTYATFLRSAREGVLRPPDFMSAQEVVFRAAPGAEDAQRFEALLATMRSVKPLMLVVALMHRANFMNLREAAERFEANDMIALLEQGAPALEAAGLESYCAKMVAEWAQQSPQGVEDLAWLLRQR